MTYRDIVVAVAAAFAGALIPTLWFFYGICF